MKKCATCKENKEDTEFFKCNQQKGGLATICKACEKEYRHARYAKNKQAQGTLTEKVCTKCDRTLPIDMFTRTPALKGGRYNHCQECESTIKKEYYSGQAARNRRSLSMIKQRAKKENLPFDIEIADIPIPTHCPVLGIPLSLDSPNRDNYPSVDRIVPALGYVKGNVVVISYRANRIKNDATVDELDKIASFYRNL